MIVIRQYHLRNGQTTIHCDVKERQSQGQHVLGNPASTWVAMADVTPCVTPSATIHQGTDIDALMNVPCCEDYPYEKLLLRPSSSTSTFLYQSSIRREEPPLQQWT